MHLKKIVSQLIIQIIYNPFIWFSFWQLILIQNFFSTFLYALQIAIALFYYIFFIKISIILHICSTCKYN